MNKNNKIAMKYFICLLFFALSYNQNILIISGSTFDFTNTSRLELSRLFLMQSDKLQERYVVPVNLEDEYLTMEFLIQLTGKSEKKIREHFLKMELRGEGTWPKTAVDEKHMILDILRVKKNLGWITEDYFNTLPQNQKEKINIVMNIPLSDEGIGLDN